LSDITAALRQGIAEFGRSVPGFDTAQGLLHGVETRTSAPVQVLRREGSCEAVGLDRLFPAGEGAGYAGGIVSAAVDGLRVARALMGHLGVGVGASVVGGALEQGAGKRKEERFEGY